MKIKSILSTLSMFVAIAQANHPSFDCNKVKKESSEGVICASDTLMNLDRELSALYKQAKTKATKEDRLKATQRGWIKGRNDCWKDANEAKCMEVQYKMRIDELKKKYGLSTKKTAVKTYSFEKTLTLQGITFDVHTTGEGSLRQLTITPHGLAGVNEVITKEIEGSVVGAEVADLNRDGFPEIYVYVASVGSGSYGSLVAYSSNSNKSMTAIYLPELSDDKKNSVGYMGHDEFSVIESSLGRRFPVYNKEDSNANPTGGMRQLSYKLSAGEAGWVLKLVHSAELK